MKKLYTNTRFKLPPIAIGKNYSIGLVLLLCVLFSSSFLTAQEAEFNWAYSSNSVDYQEGIAICVDNEGNSYITGRYMGSIEFPPDAGISNLSAVGDFDSFVMKIDPDGNILWANNIGGSGPDIGKAIEVSDNGQVYVAGTFENEGDFDPGTGMGNLMAGGPEYEIFISIFDTDGNYIWSESFGDYNAKDLFDLKVDDSNNMYLAGNFTGTVDFDPNYGPINLTSNGAFDSFLMKMDPLGNVLWAKSMGGTGTEECISIDVDMSGNIYATGRFEYTVDFDPGMAVDEFTSNGGRDVYVQKLDSDGDYLWCKTFGSFGNDVGFGIELDPMGDICLAGYYFGTVDFDPGNLTSYLTSSGITDAFVSKLDSNGDFIWARSLSGTSIEGAYDLALDGLGNIYSAGTFYATVDFDPGAGSYELTANSSGSDNFISKLDPMGNFVWAKAYGSDIDDNGLGLAVSASGSVYTTGAFGQTVDFDPGVGTSNLTSTEAADMYVLKLGCKQSFGTHVVTACNSYDFNGITYTENNLTAKDTLINSAGCDSIITLNLTIETIDVGISLNGNTITANLNGAAYQWINCMDSSPIAGETNQSFTPTENGDYAVIVSNDDCSDTSICQSIITTSIQDETFFHNLKVYPNPSDGNVNLDFGNILGSPTLIIRNVLGKEVLSKTYEETENLEIYLDQPAGIYILTIQVGDKKSIHRLIKN